MSDIDAIRAKRLAELSSNSTNGGATGGQTMPELNGMGGNSNPEDAQKRAAENESRRTIISQILDGDARERLSRIALVRPQRAQAIEDLLMRMAKGGQLRGRVTEEQLLGVLDQVEANEKGAGGQSGEPSSSKIVFSRKKVYDSDDSF